MTEKRKKTTKNDETKPKAVKVKTKKNVKAKVKKAKVKAKAKESVSRLPDESGFYSRVGKKLRELREERQISLSDAATVTGSTRQALSLYEQGKRPIPSYQLVRLAERLRVKPAKIIRSSIG